MYFQNDCVVRINKTILRRQFDQFHKIEKIFGLFPPICQLEKMRRNFLNPPQSGRGEGRGWGLEYLDKAITYACRERVLTQVN
jgi:hypothetical protein